MSSSDGSTEAGGDSDSSESDEMVPVKYRQQPWKITLFETRIRRQESLF